MASQACAAYPAGSSGSGECSVRCAASESGQYQTCCDMDVHSGARGTAVACLEEPGTAAVSTSEWTCKGLNLHAPPDDGDGAVAAADAPLSLSCASCEGSSAWSGTERCCYNAEIKPATRSVVHNNIPPPAGSAHPRTIFLFCTRARRSIDCFRPHALAPPPHARAHFHWRPTHMHARAHAQHNRGTRKKSPAPPSFSLFTPPTSLGAEIIPPL